VINPPAKNSRVEGRVRDENQINGQIWEDSIYLLDGESVKEPRLMRAREGASHSEGKSKSRKRYGAVYTPCLNVARKLSKKVFPYTSCHYTKLSALTRTESGHYRFCEENDIPEESESLIQGR
jgi:hypothetical protein